MKFFEANNNVLFKLDRKNQILNKTNNVLTIYKTIMLKCLSIYLISLI